MNKKEERFFKLYQKEITEIRSMLSGDSENSIQNLLYNLSWNDTVYRTFNKGLYFMHKKGNEDKLPGTLVEYIHNAHLSLIIALLRKLFEPNKRGKHSVNSLPTVIKKIKNNIHLWTRENYVCYDGISYETSGFLSNRTNMIIENRHIRFDNMMDEMSNRRRDDKLSIEIINEIEKKAKLNNYVERFANNFLFHAANKKNCPDEEDIFNQTTLLKIQNEMKKAVWIIHQIGKIVDQLVLTEVATPQFDQLEAWDKSFFDTEIKHELENYWDERVDIWKGWSKKYWYTDEIYISLNKIYKKN